MDEVSGDVKLDERELEDVGDGSIDLTKCKSDRDYSMGFQELTGDNSLYQKHFILNGRVEHIVLGTYVDDCIVTASSESARAWFMKRLEHRFPEIPSRRASSELKSQAMCCRWKLSMIGRKVF